MAEINGYNTPFYYEYQPTGISNNYCVSANTQQASPITMHYSSKMKDTTITGELPYKTPAPKSMAKRVLRIFSPFKKIRANHIIMLSMLALTCLSRGVFSSTPNPSNSGQSGLQYSEAAYKRGMQQVRDSVRIANLEKELKLTQDSVKLLKRTAK